MNILAMIISMLLWACIGHQIASGDHWSLIAFFVFLAIGNAIVAVTGIGVGS